MRQGSEHEDARPQDFALRWLAWRDAWDIWRDGQSDNAGIRPRILSLLNDFQKMQMAVDVVDLNFARYDDSLPLNSALFVMIRQGHAALFMLRLRSLTAGENLFGDDGEHSLRAVLLELQRDRTCFSRQFLTSDALLTDSERQWAFTHFSSVAGERGRFLPKKWISARVEDLSWFQRYIRAINKYLLHAATPQSRAGISSPVFSVEEATEALERLVRLGQMIACVVTAGQPLDADELALPDLDHLEGRLLHPDDHEVLRARCEERLKRFQAWMTL